jgi:hypothetical protein
MPRKRRSAPRPKTRDLSGVLPNVDHVPLVEVEIDDEWRERVKQRIAELRTTDGKPLRQEDVAAWIGMGQPNFSELLNMNTPSEKRPRHTQFAQRLSIALGIVLPRTAEVYLVAMALDKAGDADHLDSVLRELKTRLDWVNARK